MLCRPTRVADVICHALSPLLSQLGDEDEFWYAISIHPAMVSSERLVGRMGKEEEGIDTEFSCKDPRMFASDSLFLLVVYTTKYIYMASEDNKSVQVVFLQKKAEYRKF
jgi:hypothetical protein